LSSVSVFLARLQLFLQKPFTRKTRVVIAYCRYGITRNNVVTQEICCSRLQIGVNNVTSDNNDNNSSNESNVKKSKKLLDLTDKGRAAASKWGITFKPEADVLALVYAAMADHPGAPRSYIISQGLRKGLAEYAKASEKAA
jgi:hypothetical protein